MGIDWFALAEAAAEVCSITPLPLSNHKQHPTKSEYPYLYFAHHLIICTRPLDRLFWILNYCSRFVHSHSEPLVASNLMHACSVSFINSRSMHAFLPFCFHGDCSLHIGMAVVFEPIFSPFTLIDPDQAVNDDI